MDTFTGFSFEKLEKKTLKGIPRLGLFTHRNMSFTDGNVMDGFRIYCGSFFDGSAVLQRMIGLGPDVDSMLEICLPIPIRRNDKVIEYCAECPIYCRINVLHSPVLRKAFPGAEKHGTCYLSTRKIRQNIKKYMELTRDSQLEISGHVFSLVDIPGKASLLQEKGHTNPMDFVLCIPCRGWPQCDELRWADPTIHTFLRERGKFHLVPKCRPEGDPELDWRVSFTEMENLMVSQWNHDMRTTYALFKCIIKHHVGLSDFITSYHLKTVMLLNQDRMLNYPNLGFGFYLLAVLDHLNHFLAEKCLPMFFCEQVNLLKDIPGKVLVEFSQKLSSLRKGLHQMPDNLGLFKSIHPSYEIASLLVEYASFHMHRCIAKNHLDPIFYEPGLIADPEVLLYMWESFLYKAKQFVGEREERFVLYAMIHPSSHLMRIGDWSGLYDSYLRKNRKEVKIEENDKYTTVYYQTYDGLCFRVKSKQIPKVKAAEEHEFIHIPGLGLWFENVTQLHEPEDEDACSNLIDLIAKCPYTDYMSLKELKRTSYQLHENLLLKITFQKIYKAACVGELFEFGELLEDPESLLYLWESFLHLTMFSVFPDEEEIVHQTMLTTAFKKYFYHLWLHLHILYEEQPDLFECLKDTSDWEVNKSVMYELSFEEFSFRLISKNLENPEIELATKSIPVTRSPHRCYKGCLHLSLSTNIVISDSGLSKIERLVKYLRQGDRAWMIGMS